VIAPYLMKGKGEIIYFRAGRFIMKKGLDVGIH
jgi:hypothetical protein